MEDSNAQEYGVISFKQPLMLSIFYLIQSFHTGLQLNK